jgi:toxin secretion/phage lysis holin
MREIWNWIQVGCAAVGGVLGGILGGLDGFLYALIAFVVIDYITGVMRAVVDKKLSSEVGFHGIFKKILIFAMVAVGNILDTHILGTGTALRTAIIFFYLANEGLSLLENTARLGLPVPDKLKEVLAQLHNGKSAPKTDDPSEPGDGEYIHPPHPEPVEPKENESEENDNENLS